MHDPERDIRDIPLSQLELSPDNLRKTPADASAFTELKASIAAHGLLENLIARAMEPGPDGPGRYAVIAGGRRLAAMQALAAEGALEEDHPVPCRMIEDIVAAEEVLLAENSVRAAMHPADQVEAFRRLADAGSTAAAIAARFGVSERTVEKRLRLGNAAPVLLEAYRAGETDLETLMAFAVTTDQARQSAVWETVSQQGYRPGAWQIKRLLTEDRVPATSAIARFVGLEAYEAAGGRIDRDLFAEEDERGIWFDDPDLLNKLAMDSLQVAARELETRWKWAEARLDVDWSATAAFGRVRPQPAEPTDEEKGEIERLRTRNSERANMDDDGWTVNGGAKRDHRGGVRRDHLAAAGLSPSPWEGPGCDAACPQQADAAARAGGTCGPTGSSVGWVVGSVRRRGLTPAALVEPVALAIHLEDVDVVGEAVEESAGEALGAEHLGPFVEGQIGGDQGRAPLVALAEHLEQQLGAGLRQRHEAEFVDDQKLVGGELLLEPQQLLVIAGLDELVDQCGGGDEADREALLAGRQAETEGDVGLAGAAVAERDEVLAALDVLAAGQLQDQRLVERGDDLEVEAVEALDHGEARRLDAPLDHAALAVDQLELGESQQVADVIDAFRGALPGDLVVLAQEGRQLQRLEVVGEQHLRCVGHAPSPDSRLMYDLADVIATRARGRYG